MMNQPDLLIADGTDRRQFIAAKADGGEEVEFIDRPMQKEKYDESYRIMKEAKKCLIDDEYTIIKTGKPRNKYVVGGRVVDKATSIHKDKTGTITSYR
jgi:hypothetical protein